MNNIHNKQRFNPMTYLFGIQDKALCKNNEMNIEYQIYSIVLNKGNDSEYDNLQELIADTIKPLSKYLIITVTIENK